MCGREGGPRATSPCASDSGSSSHATEGKEFVTCKNKSSPPPNNADKHHPTSTHTQKKTSREKDFTLPAVNDQALRWLFLCEKEETFQVFSGKAADKNKEAPCSLGPHVGLFLCIQSAQDSHCTER